MTPAEYVYPNSSVAFVEAVKLFATSQCILGQCFRPSDYIQDDSMFDYIIIGGGSAGCVLANRLSEDEKINVLLVEAGGDPPLESIVPGLVGNLDPEKYEWVSRTENDHYSSQFLVNSTVAVTGGKMLGGSSSHNSMFFLRGNRRDYNQWADSGNRNWDYDSLLQYFKKIETVTNPYTLSLPNSRVYRGRSGPIKLSDNKEISKHDTLVLKLFNEFGIKYNPDFNAGINMGVGIPDYNIYDGIRQSSAIAYLIPAQQRKNLFILKHTAATKVLIDHHSKKAYGVELKAKYGTIKAFVKKCSGEIILSAGAINTPQLLMLSGVGPKKHLEEKNIHVVVDLPVGGNLQHHPYLLVYLSADVDDSEPKAESKISEYAQYLYDRSGELAIVTAASKFVAFYSLNNTSYPDVQIYTKIFPKNTSVSAVCNSYGVNETLCAKMGVVNSYRDVFLLGMAVTSLNSTGKILLRDTKPESSPLVFTNFGQDPTDLDKMALVLEKLTDLINTPTLKKYSTKFEFYNIPGCETYDPFSRDYWRCYYLNVAFMFHWVGTAKMGPRSDKTAVVDDHLRVHGIGNLRVVDASVMPKIVSANTNYAVTVIAERAADIIKTEYRKKSQYCEY